MVLIFLHITEIIESYFVSKFKSVHKDVTKVSGYKMLIMQGCHQSWCADRDSKHLTSAFVSYQKWIPCWIHWIAAAEFDFKRMRFIWKWMWFAVNNVIHFFTSFYTEVKAKSTYKILHNFNSRIQEKFFLLGSRV